MASVRHFIALQEQIRVIKSRKPMIPGAGRSDEPIVSGFIVEVEETDQISDQSFVKFKQEGMEEIKEIRLLAFEQTNRLITKITLGLETNTTDSSSEPAVITDKKLLAENRLINFFTDLHLRAPTVKKTKPSFSERMVKNTMPHNY